MSWRSSEHALTVPADVRWMHWANAVLLIGLALAAVGLGTRWAMKHPQFAITRIVVEGDTAHHNALTLQANIAGRLQGNFFTVDLAKTRAVFESVPWVRQAVVRREFPSTLRVRLQEHQAIALWGADTESRMVNTHGEVFEANVGDVDNALSGRAEVLPRWVGAEGQSLALMQMQGQLSSLLGETGSSIQRLELSARNSWRATLDGGAVLELGRGSLLEVAERTRKFLQTHQQVLAAYQRNGLDRIETLDLRYGSGYAIRLRGVSTGAAESIEKKS